MNRKLVSLILGIFLFLLAGNSVADEGMWMINLVSKNINAMQTLGLKLTAEDIYSINHSSLKDAIVQFDDGSCTAELVSAKGMFFTNHHCGVDAVQSLSTVSNNLLENGYWAGSLSEELPVEGKTALILVGVEDITSQVFDSVASGFDNEAYFNRINEVMDKIQEENNVKTGLYTVVRPFFNYNQFFKFTYERYLDVRLVGVPPTSIGNFGGDVDNWHWPRHTGDFCIFRIYTGPDGKPAPYSTRNIPYKSKKFLKISLNGVNEDDFAMIIGYPGRTFRYATSYEAQYNRDVVADYKRDVWGRFINIIKEARDNGPKAKVDYTEKHDYLVNFYQKDVWQAESMSRFNVVERLKEREDSLRSWVNQNPSQRSRYISAIPVVKGYFDVATANKWEAVENSMSAMSFFPVDVYKHLDAATDLLSAIYMQGKPYGKFEFWKTDHIRKAARELKPHIPDVFKNYHYDTDMKLYITAFGNFLENTGSLSNMGLLNAIKKVDKINELYPYYIEGFYKRSYFTSSENLSKLVKYPYMDSLLKDPLFILYHNYRGVWDSIYPIMAKSQADFNRAMQLYTKGIMEMNSGKLLYPDANSTMRLTYGKVIGYKPADGLYYKPFTTLDGVMDKENPNEDVFIVPQKLKELWRNKDYGRYGKDGVMPVCFLTDNDITGGNSGSPVLNAEGELIGLAFDGNSEAMACDFMYEPKMQRTIVADIRYVLFVVDKFANAQHIMNELEIQ